MSRCIGLVIALILLPAFVVAEEVEFTSEASVIESNSGHIKLEWEAEMDTIFELQRAPTRHFSEPTISYKGPDRASFISGLEEGEYYYRVRTAGGAWSEPLLIRVRYQSMTLAFTLFGLGGIVFLLTVLVVIRGVRQTNHAQS